MANYAIQPLSNLQIPLEDRIQAVLNELSETQFVLTSHTFMTFYIVFDYLIEQTTDTY